MSEIDEYRALLKAKVDEMQRDQQEREVLLGDSSQRDGFPMPSPEFVQGLVEHTPQMSEAEINMAAWQRLEKERSGETHQWETTEPEQQSNEPVWPTEKINLEFNREGEHQQSLELADDQQKEKEAQRQHDQEIADNKTRQIEADKEKQRLANEQEQQKQQDEIQRQAAERTQAEHEKQQAQVNLAEQERAAPDNEVDQYRAMFEQAAENTQSVERDIE